MSKTQKMFALIFFALILWLFGGFLLYYVTGKDGAVLVSTHCSRIPGCITALSSDDKNSSISTVAPTKRTPKKSRDRLAVISYLPAGISQITYFLVMLYGSWRFIIDHQNQLFPGNKYDDINDIDLLVFCHPSICKEVRDFCTPIKALGDLKPVNSISRCYAIEQPFEANILYGFINSFVMFNRSDINELITRYKYVMRTDNDVFITPAIYRLKPEKFLHGHGAYSDPFNMKRLKEVASRLNMIHRGRHAIGSTWCGDTKVFIKAGKLTLYTTKHIYLNEFDPKAKGLETIDFKKNRVGEWIRWYKPVSLLYGGEIALNHLLKNFSDANKEKFDSSSCDEMSIWKTSHIHCWHKDCEFQKFKFMKYLNIVIKSRETLPGKIVHHIIEYMYPHNITSMSLREYSTFIAWSSVSKYLL